MASSDENFCNECYRQYPNSSKYQTHLKVKHRQSKQNQKDSAIEEQMHEIEDKIYVYFGELSQIYAENIRPNEPQNLLQEQRFIGQANYLTNSAVRTPYQNQINPVESIPQSYEFHPIIGTILATQEVQKIIGIIKQQIDILHKKLNEERDHWQFADPQISLQEEFSIFDVRKLVKNYHKKNLHLRFPELCIFLVWIARICKLEMFQVIYELLVSYTICFESYCKKEFIPYLAKRTLKSWMKFSQAEKQFKTEIKYEKDNGIRSFTININQKNISIKKLEKLLDLYDSWISVVMPSLPPNKKSDEVKQNQVIIIKESSQ